MPVTHYWVPCNKTSIGLWGQPKQNKNNYYYYYSWVLRSSLSSPEDNLAAAFRAQKSDRCANLFTTSMATSSEQETHTGALEESKPVHMEVPISYARRYSSPNYSTISKEVKLCCCDVGALCVSLCMMVVS